MFKFSKRVERAAELPVPHRAVPNDRQRPDIHLLVAGIGVQRQIHVLKLDSNCGIVLKKVIQQREIMIDADHRK